MYKVDCGESGAGDPVQLIEDLPSKQEPLGFGGVPHALILQ